MTKRRRRRRQQRVAVGIGLGDDFGADIAAGAGVVLDDHRLPPFARQPIGDDARHDVGGAAGRKRHHDLDRVRRIILRLCRGVAPAQPSAEQQASQGGAIAADSVLRARSALLKRHDVTWRCSRRASPKALRSVRCRQSFARMPLCLQRGRRTVPLSVSGSVESWRARLSAPRLLGARRAQGSRRHRGRRRRRRPDRQCHRRQRRQPLAGTVIGAAVGGFSAIASARRSMMRTGGAPMRRRCRRSKPDLPAPGRLAQSGLRPLWQCRAGTGLPGQWRHLPAIHPHDLSSTARRRSSAAPPAAILTAPGRR